MESSSREVVEVMKIVTNEQSKQFDVIRKEKLEVNKASSCELTFYLDLKLHSLAVKINGLSLRVCNLSGQMRLSRFAVAVYIVGRGTPR